jgi:hypothetical protein
MGCAACWFTRSAYKTANRWRWVAALPVQGRIILQMRAAASASQTAFLRNLLLPTLRNIWHSKPGLRSATQLRRCRPAGLVLAQP